MSEPCFGPSYQELEAQLNKLKSCLERAGWGPCNIPACNCNGWHHLRESVEEHDLRTLLAEKDREIGELKKRTEVLTVNMNFETARANTAEHENAQLAAKLERIRKELVYEKSCPFCTEAQPCAECLTMARVEGAVQAILSESPQDIWKRFLGPVREAAEKSFAATSEVWASEVLRLLNEIMKP